MGDCQRALTISADSHELDIASVTHIGRSRSENQDRCCWFETSRSGSYIIIVADGMGGQAGGGIAADIAIASVKTIFGKPYNDPVQTLRDSFELACKGLTDRASADSSLRDMGCTLSLALYYEGIVYTAHIGDSRIYRFSDGKCDQISVDHSLVQEMVSQGALNPERMRSHPKGNILLKALTTNPDNDIDIYPPISVGQNDVFLVCSDGLWNMVEDTEIQHITVNNPAKKAVNRLIDRANELGGVDNIAVGIMRII